MRITSLAHWFFAVTMIGLGCLILLGDVPPTWAAVAAENPVRPALVIVAAAVSLGGGIGLLFEKTRGVASRALFAAFLLWFLVFRLPLIPTALKSIGAWWGAGHAAVMMAGAWVLFIDFNAGWGGSRLALLKGDGGLRIARLCFGLGLLPFGAAHYLYVQATTVLIPSWIPWHEFMAYATGTAFLAAGLAIIAGVRARLAAALVTLQFALFLIVVWIPILIRGTYTPFQWGEMITTWAISAAAWVVAESYRGKPAGAEIGRPG